MKIVNFFKRQKGFTLTEILLAVMIVGLIGVALASLTRASAREAGVGRSKIMLRNNLSSFVQLLRKDLASDSLVEAEGEIPANAASGGHYPLLKILKGASPWGEATESFNLQKLPAEKVTYCFKVGAADDASVVPNGALRGGEIYRLRQTTMSADYKSCNSSNYLKNAVVLPNVKYIPSNVKVSGDNYYSVPLFAIDSSSNCMLKVHLITELQTTPVVNEAVEWRFDVPYKVCEED